MPKYTYAERVILVNQFKILAALNPDEAKFYAKAEKAFSEGFTRAYDSFTQNVYRDEMDGDDAEATVDALEMYWDMQHSYAQLDDQSGIDPSLLGFPGFDGNRETNRLGYARFLIEDERKFEGLKLNNFKSLNSHMPTTEMYARMLPVYERARKAAGSAMRSLTREEIGAVLAERIHPSNRK